jgi:hypothetical protein
MPGRRAGRGAIGTGVTFLATDLAHAAGRRDRNGVFRVSTIVGALRFTCS